MTDPLAQSSAASRSKRYRERRESGTQVLQVELTPTRLIGLHYSLCKLRVQHVCDPEKPAKAIELLLDSFATQLLRVDPVRLSQLQDLTTRQR
jgi:hypothetical protein